MLSENKRSELESSLNLYRNNFGAYLYRIYWHMIIWSEKEWKADGWTEITTDHLKVISLVARIGETTNNELSKLVGVTKQAMSQMITLLEKRGVLTVETNPADSRAKIITLSEYGIDFMIYFGTKTQELFNKYAAVIGEENMNILSDLAGKLLKGLADVGENVGDIQLREFRS